MYTCFMLLIHQKDTTYCMEQPYCSTDYVWDNIQPHALGSEFLSLQLLRNSSSYNLRYQYNTRSVQYTFGTYNTRI